MGSADFTLGWFSLIYQIGMSCNGQNSNIIPQWVGQSEGGGFRVRVVDPGGLWIQGEGVGGGVGWVDMDGKWKFWLSSNSIQNN